MSSLTMTEPLEAGGTQWRLSGKEAGIPSGVMQVVLMHALQLRRSCREVFLLCDIQRHSITEAAAILGISRTAAKRRLHLAHRRMDEVIERLCHSAASRPVKSDAQGWIIRGRRRVGRR
jgi:DNA-directed RNA polymerase specialized sigma24 family protein